MKTIKLLCAILLRVFYTLKITGIPRFNKEEEYIIWAPGYFSPKFLLSDNFQRANFYYFHLKQNKLKVSIYTKWSIGKFNNAKIYIIPNVESIKEGFKNYAGYLVWCASMLEDQQNKVFPNSYEMKFWENKTFMHEEFNRKEINQPKTDIVTVDSVENEIPPRIDFPFLLKEEHSCSSKGLYKFSSSKEYKTMIPSLGLKKRNNKVLIQELLNIRKDLRVITIGQQIVHYYWRINPSNNWKPTSTGHGSEVDFENFPEKWKSKIIEQISKLNLSTAGIDIAWENDDISTEPIILEVSPFYQPNPKPINITNLKKYGIWKKSVFGSDSYPKAFVQLQNRISKEIISFSLMK